VQEGVVGADGAAQEPWGRWALKFVFACCDAADVLRAQSSRACVKGWAVCDVCACVCSSPWLSRFRSYALYPCPVAVRQMGGNHEGTWK